MAYGLKCWDGDGNVTLSVTDRLTKVLGTTTIRCEANTGSSQRIALPSETNKFNFWIAIMAYRSLYTEERAEISYVLGENYADLILSINAYQPVNGWVEYDVLYGVY